MDVDTVLVSVQERDKWQRRLTLLQQSLSEIRDRKGRVEKRLRRIRRDLAKLGLFSDAVLDHAARLPLSRSVHATHDTQLPAR
jgi:hypothetical protein